jgi:hypothetical protein
LINFYYRMSLASRRKHCRPVPCDQKPSPVA